MNRTPTAMHASMTGRPTISSYAVSANAIITQTPAKMATMPPMSSKLNWLRALAFCSGV